MPVHDWTRITAGTFHDFHKAWITELCNALNNGVLPEDYYALGEQRSGDVNPDVLTLHAETTPPWWTSETTSDDTGMVAVAGDRIVALIAILSPGNKHSQHTIGDFLDKVVAALRAGYHVLVLDLFPPGRCDPSGIHGAIWEYITNEPWPAPSDRPLTLNRRPFHAEGGEGTLLKVVQF